MMEKDKKITLLVILLLISTTAAVIGFVRKGTSAPAIALFMYNKDASYENEYNFNSTPFWDNYPYWVLMSKGKEFPARIKVKGEEGQELSLEELFNKQGPFFFRYHAAQKDDSVVINTLLAIKKSDVQVSVITDMKSKLHLKEKDQYALFGQFIYTTTEVIPIDMEKSRLSYFFRVRNNKIEDLFVPRMEIPEVTWKYLESVGGRH